MKRKNKREPLISLAIMLKEIRCRKRLTLEQLSTIADVSKAMLSQIEQGKVNPTLAVILKISQSLGVQISELLNIEEKPHFLRLIRDDEEAYTFRTTPLCKLRSLSPLEMEKEIEFYRLILEPTGSLVSESHFPRTEEVLYVSKGRVEIAVAEKKTALNKGDSIHYRADLPHSIKNVGKGQAEVFIVMRYRE